MPKSKYRRPEDRILKLFSRLEEFRRTKVSESEAMLMDAGVLAESLILRTLNSWTRWSTRSILLRMVEAKELEHLIINQRAVYVLPGMTPADFDNLAVTWRRLHKQKLSLLSARPIEISPEDLAGPEPDPDEAEESRIAMRDAALGLDPTYKVPKIPGLIRIDFTGIGRTAP